MKFNFFSRTKQIQVKPLNFSDSLLKKGNVTLVIFPDFAYTSSYLQTKTLT